MIRIRPHADPDHDHATPASSASPALTPDPATVTGPRSYGASRKTRGRV